MIRIVANLPSFQVGDECSIHSSRTKCYNIIMALEYKQRKEYMAKYIRKHYADNKQYYYNKAKIRKQKIKDFVANLKRRPCTDCNVEYPPYVMQFDHTGEKTINIARVADMGWSEKRIMEELSRCELVCSNCHAERTFQRRNADIV